jgi:hypothetical protein
MGHDGRSLVSAAGRRGARILPPSGTTAGPYRRATRHIFIYFFIF